MQEKAAVMEKRTGTGVWQALREIPCIKRRLGGILVGNIIMGLAIAMLRMSLFGNDPFSCMNLGYGILTGLSFSVCVILYNCVLILLVLVLDRSYIHIGTIVNMFLLGFMGDAFYSLLLLPLLGEPAELTLMTRVLLLVIGIPVSCLGASPYICANLGMGPYDAIGWIAEKRLQIEFRYFRIGLDAVSVIIGFALGSIVGIGTLVMALFTGPLIAWFNVKLGMPLIYGKERAD